MKMTSEHYEILKSAVIGTWLDKSKYSSDRRYRWDTLWAATMGRTTIALPEKFVTTTLYTYLNDAHIDTALRKIHSHSK